MSLVRSLLPSAFLAGGALRDLDNGRAVKDLDVFYTDNDPGFALDEALKKQGYTYHKYCAGDYMHASGEVQDACVWVSSHGQPDLNLVHLVPSFNPASIIDRVDFGLCQIGCDALGVTSTPAYQYDKEHQCFTLTRAESVEGVERSLKRYARLSRKYPGWRLNVPKEFEPLVQEATERFWAVEETF